MDEDERRRLMFFVAVVGIVVALVTIGFILLTEFERTQYVDFVFKGDGYYKSVSLMNSEGITFITDDGDSITFQNINGKLVVSQKRKVLSERKE